MPEGGAPVEEDAVTLFTTTVQDSPEPITVLALGPLTNVGAALEATPALVDNIEMIYVMGGAVDVDGSFVSETNTTAEWNIYSDPHAARLTFESGAPITLIPLDATNEVPVTPEFVEQLEAEKASPAAEFVATLLANNAESIESGSYYFWDPLAAVVMADPEHRHPHPAHRDRGRHPRRSRRRPHHAGRQRRRNPRRHGARWCRARSGIDRRLEHRVSIQSQIFGARVP